MKYGDTLRQRSIPEWGHYNIDYDYLKDLIKHHTTPGTNKAISIPGQGESTERAFREAFFDVLLSQHDRINLFVQSKSGEIERRLHHIGRSLAQLRAKHANVARGARLPARTVERYAKIDADVAKTGQEIRSLARFQSAQRTGFVKILKKYRRWTKDRELGRRFKDEVMHRPDTLFQLDLGYLLEQYIDVLDALRSIFDNDDASANNLGRVNGQSSVARMSKALETGEELDFDLALATVPLGSHGNRAIYWVHPDHIVEMQVLLLQYMHLFSGSTRNATRNCSAQGTPRRRLSSTANFDRYFGNDDDVGLVILDHAETFAIEQNASTIESTEEAHGTIGMQAAGNIRCTSAGKAAVVVCTERGTRGNSSVNTRAAKMERKDLRGFLDTKSPGTESGGGALRGDGSAENTVDDNVAIRNWLRDHESTKAIAGAVSKRTRFVGLANKSVGGTWATLDCEVYMKDTLHRDLESDDWTSISRSDSAKFPHAILEVRCEGYQASSLIQMLNQNHLVERVRGFSIEAHTLWTCCKPSTMSQPLWIPLLDKDIRKLPEIVKRRTRRGKTSATSSRPPSPHVHGSTSNTSYDGQSSPIASRNGESSATSAQEYLDSPPLQAFRKKTRRPFADYPPPIVHSNPEPEAPRYWNEYDDPENEESGYYIYVDPDAPIKYPGQELVEACAQATRRLFNIRNRAEVASLSAIEDATTDDEDSGDDSPTLLNTSYGTLSSSPHKDQAHDGYFSTLFRSLRDPRHDAALLNERRTLLGELELRQHTMEMMKLRLYSTCLVTALCIDAILGLMTVTSRKRERGAVDLGVLFGTVVTLMLCVVALLSMKTRRERLGWVHQGVVVVAVVVVVMLDVLLLSWVFRI